MSVPTREEVARAIAMTLYDGNPRYWDDALNDGERAEFLEQADAVIALFPSRPDIRSHLFAESSSRYDLRCVRCGVPATAREAVMPCTKEPLSDERTW